MSAYSGGMNTIGHFLHEDAIALDVPAPDWREAITSAGQLLEARGAIEPEYTAAMIGSVEDNGPYIVISPGFAFAHARPSEAVHRTEMSLVRLAEPVEFGHAKNDPVTLVVALAAVDAKAHTTAMAQLAKILAAPAARRGLDEATTARDILRIVGGDDTTTPAGDDAGTAATTPGEEPSSRTNPGGAGTSATRDHILTVCGNGLGTSLFLKNTLEQVLDAWGWGPYISVEATDTISAKGKAKEADCILTSGEIARTLGDPGIPVRVIDNFTSTAEVDAALRSLYDV